MTRLVSSLLYSTRATLVLNWPAFRNKKYTAYDSFHGNGPYDKIPTKKGPIRMLGFPSRLPCHVITYFTLRLTLYRCVFRHFVQQSRLAQNWTILKCLWIHVKQTSMWFLSCQVLPNVEGKKWYVYLQWYLSYQIFQLFYRILLK